MSFNIRYDELRDGVNAWSNRKQKVADVIRFHKAELVGVQEALLTQLRDLETMLPDMAWWGLGGLMVRKRGNIRRFSIVSRGFTYRTAGRSGCHQLPTLPAAKVGMLHFRGS